MSRTPHAARFDDKPREEVPKVPAVEMPLFAPGGWQQATEWEWFIDRVNRAGLIFSLKRHAIVVPVWVPPLFNAPYGTSDADRVESFLRFVADRSEQQGAVQTLLAMVEPGQASTRGALVLYAKAIWEAFEAWEKEPAKPAEVEPEP